MSLLMRENIRASLTIICITLVLNACSGSGGTKDDGSASVEDRSISSDEMNEIDRRATTSGLDEDDDFQGNPLDDPNSLLATRVIYFEYDSSNVRQEFREAIAEHARYLADNPGASMTLEGHADERGSREYNLALSENRALSVRRQMVLLGATADQIRTVSYGEERPATDGHDEAAYALNRRVEIIY